MFYVEIYDKSIIEPCLEKTCIKSLWRTKATIRLTSDCVVRCKDSTVYVMRLVVAKQNQVGTLKDNYSNKL